MFVNVVKFIKKKRIVSLILSFLSLSLVYIGGSFLSGTHFEKIAEYATDLVINHTENKKYCAITVEASKDSGTIADSTFEFHQLYGVFRQQKITFASAMNVDKRHNITLGDSISENLSVLYVGPAGTVEYNGHYKHYVYPTEMMFADEKNYDINKYVVYISQSHADRLLDSNPNFKRNENNEYGLDDYKKLLKTNIPIFIDGNEYEVLVQNIYFQSNYYYEGLNDVMGDFVISSYYFHQNLRSEQQNIYFMSEYTYQNKFFMNYINDVYSSKKFIVKLNHYNLRGDVDDSRLLDFYYSNEIYKLNWLADLIFVFSGVLLFCSVILIVYQNRTLQQNNTLWMFINILVLFIPYLLFKTLYTITRNVSLLSVDSGKLNFWFIIFFVLLQIITPLVLKAKPRRRRLSVGDYYEVNI